MSDEKTPHNEDGGRPAEQVNRRRLHNRGFLIAFLITLVAYAGLSFYCIAMMVADSDDELDFQAPDWMDSVTVTTSSGSVTNGRRGKRDSTVDFESWLNKKSIEVFAFITAIGIGLSIGLLFFVRFFPKVVVYMAPVFAVIFTLGMAAFGIYMKVWLIGGIASGLAALSVLSLFLLHRKYELATDLLNTTNKAAKAHPSVYLIVILGVLAQAVNSIWNITTVIAIFLRFEPWHASCKTGDFCSAAVTWILLAFAIVSHMWISGVITNVTLTVLAGGPYARWYFGEDSDQHSESLWAFKRCMTTSLGSIALGSLIVTAVEVFKFLVEIFSSEGNCLARCCVVVLRCVQRLVAKFNKFVYIRIGVEKFDKGFIDSAKDTIKFLVKGKGIHRQGIEVLIADSIVGAALGFASIANATLCTFATYLLSTELDEDGALIWEFVGPRIEAIDGTWAVDKGWNWLALIYAFMLTLCVGLVLTSALEAGVSTLFVCIDKDPDPLKQRYPEFYHRLACDDKYWRALKLDSRREPAPDEKGGYSQR